MNNIEKSEKAKNIIKDYKNSLVAYEKALELDNKEIYNVMIQMVSIKNNSFGLYFNLVNELMNNKFLMNKLEDKEFQNKILSVQNNIFDALKDKDIMNIVENIANNLHLVNNS